MIDPSSGPAGLAAPKEKETIVRYMNHLKKTWAPAALACALIVTAMLAAAPAWAYTATVKNDTKYTVKVEVFEIRFIGVYNQVGVGVFLTPGQTATFHTTGAFCLYRYEGWYDKGKGSSSSAPETQHWEKKANDDGMAACRSQKVTVKKRSNGTFHFDVELCAL